jgi:hypothetical protein
MQTAMIDEVKADRYLDKYMRRSADWITGTVDNYLTSEG